MTQSSSPRMELPGTLAEQVLSPEAREQAIERAFVGRLVARLGTGARTTARPVEGIVKALDSGQVDEALERIAPPAAELQQERFEDLREFDYGKWRSRHGCVFPRRAGERGQGQGTPHPRM